MTFVKAGRKRQRDIGSRHTASEPAGACSLRKKRRRAAKGAPPYAVVGGAPAEAIRKRFPDDAVAALLKTKRRGRSEESMRHHTSQAGRIHCLQPLCEKE